MAAAKTTSTATEADLGFAPISEHTSAAFGLLRLSALLADELDHELQDKAGLSLSETLVLIQLMLAGGRLRMAELADTLVVTRGGVTKIIDKLVESGLVERVHSSSDRRVIFAAVTDEGKTRIRDNQGVFDEVARMRLAQLLDRSELSSLQALVDRLNCENPGWEPPEIPT